MSNENVTFSQTAYYDLTLTFKTGILYAAGVYLLG